MVATHRKNARSGPTMKNTGKAIWYSAACEISCGIGILYHSCLSEVCLSSHTHTRTTACTAIMPHRKHFSHYQTRYQNGLPRTMLQELRRRISAIYGCPLLSFEFFTQLSGHRAARACCAFASSALAKASASSGASFVSFSSTAFQRPSFG